MYLSLTLKKYTEFEFVEKVIPYITSLTPVTTAVPLVVVLTLTALKDAIDDIVSYALL